MANSQVEYTQIRFYIGELTECYVLAQASGDSPLGVQGWHHKSFPASKSAADILTPESFRPLEWGLEAPPERGR